MAHSDSTPATEVLKNDACGECPNCGTAVAHNGGNCESVTGELHRTDAGTLSVYVEWECPTCEATLAAEGYLDDAPFAFVDADQDAAEEEGG